MTYSLYVIIAIIFKKEKLYKEMVSKVLAENFQGNPLQLLKKMIKRQNKDTAEDKKDQDEFSSQKGNP